MVVRVNGAPRQGVWFSADVVFVELTATGGDFLEDLTDLSTDPREADRVNSALEQVIELVQTRGNVIGLTVETAEIVHFMVDYGQAIVPLAGVTLGGQVAQDIEVELEAAIILIDAPTDITGAAVVVFDGFQGVAQGTPI